MHTLGDVVLIAEDTNQATRNVYTGDRLPVSLKACWAPARHADDQTPTETFNRHGIFHGLRDPVGL